ncbi:MAG: hypothetical protein RLZZ447_1117, partial [Verrucomicrobiota bacterium]
MNLRWALSLTLAGLLAAAESPPA